MAYISSEGNNAIIYLTYAFLLGSGILIAWRFSKKETFLSSNGSQRAVPLILNFLASGKYYKMNC